MPDIGLQPIDGQDHAPLLLQPCLDPLLIRHAQGDQFFITLHQIGHTALRDAHSTSQQSPVHFWHTAMLTKTPAANQGNHLQPKFPVGQRPAPFFFGPVGRMIARAPRLDTATHDNRQRAIAHPTWSPCDGRDSPPTATDRTAHNALSTGSASSRASLRDAGVEVVGPWSFSC